MTSTIRSWPWARGLGTSPAVKRLILELLERHHGPMVFDADALNTLAGLETSDWPKRRNWGNIVLTPHTVEYMRLMSAVMKRGANVNFSADSSRASEAQAAEALADSAGKKTRSLVDDDDSDDAPSTADGMALDMPEEAAPASPAQAAPQTPEGQPHPDRTPLAELLARGTGTVVVLKGHRTVITDGSRYAINTTGNPAMATAGAGDSVLTGVIASLIGQKQSPLDAAVLGVHLHGLAGDLARAALCPNAAGLTAMDIAAHLPQRSLPTRTKYLKSININTPSPWARPNALPNSAPIDGPSAKICGPPVHCTNKMSAPNIKNAQRFPQSKQFPCTIITLS